MMERKRIITILMRRICMFKNEYVEVQGKTERFKKSSELSLIVGILSIILNRWYRGVAIFVLVNMDELDIGNLMEQSVKLF